MITNLQHRLQWTAEYCNQTECPACGREGEYRSIVLIDDGRWLKCAYCESVFADPFELPDYSDDYGFPNYHDYYCETGAGIEFMVQPLAAVAPAKGKARFLDVGCGYGFTVHYAQMMLGWEAMGVDPSAYARFGERDLGISIDDKLLGGGSAYDGQIFDVIMSSEVIEHIPHPRPFLALIRQHLADDGIVVLTTPNSEWVDPLRNYGDVVATAFPGFHCVLFSEGALRKAFQDAGFSDIVIIKSGGRLVSFASPAADGLAHIDVDAAWNPDYLDVILETADDSARHLRLGVKHRQLRNAVGCDRYEKAQDYLEAIRPMMAELYNLDFTDPVLVAARMRLGGNAAVGINLPFLGPTLSYLIGMMRLRDGGLSEASRWLAAVTEAVEILVEGEWSPLWWGEAIGMYREAQFARGLALLSMGEAQMALNIFAKLADPANAYADNPKLAILAPIGDGMVARALQQAGVSYLRLGRHTEASGALSASIAMAAILRDPNLAAVSEDLLRLASPSGNVDN